MSDISDLSPKAQELYHKIMSGKYLTEQSEESKEIQGKERKGEINMGIPQAIMIAVMAANVTIGFVFHNKPRTDKYNGWTTLIGCAIEAALLTAGGFFK